MSNLNLPQAMRDADRWILWKPVPDAKTGKIIKKPLDPRTRKPFPRGSHWQTDPARWVSYAEAIKTGEPLGFLLGDGFAGVDLDDVIEQGHLAPWAQAIRQQFPTYAEVSPSNTGIKLFMHGRIAGDLIGKRAGIEVYDRQRFFTVTGKTLQPLVEVTDCTEALQALYDRLASGDVIELCRLRGLLLGSGTDEYLDLICPWASEHTSATNASSTSVRADGEGFSCLHAHCAERTIGDLRRWLGLPKQAPAGAFDVTEIDLKSLTPRVWASLHGVEHLFLQGGVPVRADHVPDNRQQGRPTWVFQPLTVDKLRHEVAQVATFSMRVENAFKQVVPPSDVIRDMLAAPTSRIPLPVVSRITYAPTMAPDGTINLTPGYQPETGTFYLPDPRIAIPSVPDEPDGDALARAVATLLEPIAEFNFVGDADLIHAVGLMLLPFVRALIDGPTPLHLFKKPVAGSGATLLAETLLYPAVGLDVAKMTTVETNDEWRKTITATLLLGPTVTFIDNARELVSPILAQAITNVVWQDRILGASRTALLPVECAWVATGINPDLHTEIARRVVACRLDPQTDRPWMRTGFAIPNLRVWSRDHRGAMIAAVLTLARAWHVAGRPHPVRQLGMFEAWSDVIGGILTYAGLQGFLANLDDVYDDADVEGDAIRWFYEKWQSEHGSKPVRIHTTALWALMDGSPVHGVLSATTARGRSTQYAVWVRRLKHRVVELQNGDQVRLVQAKDAATTRREDWCLLPAVAPSEEALPF